jgi:hypothetical protein
MRGLCRPGAGFPVGMVGAALRAPAPQPGPERTGEQPEWIPRKQELEADVPSRNGKYERLSGTSPVPVHLPPKSGRRTVGWGD